MSVTVLLPAGALAAATVDSGPAERGDRQIIAAGFVQEGIVAGPTPTRSPEPSVVTAPTPAPPPPATTTTRAIPSTVTTVSRPTTTTAPLPQTTIPSVTVPPWVPPPLPTSTIPGGSSWSNRADGVSVRMHMEPARPVAGQPVTFVVDSLITQDPCCAVAISFGDSPTFTNLTGGGSCASPTSLSNLSITHTYASPGAYEAVLATATFPCGPIVGDPPHRAIHGVGLHVCIVVGPGEAGAGGCVQPAGG